MYVDTVWVYYAISFTETTILFIVLIIVGLLKIAQTAIFKNEIVVCLHKF